MKNSIIFPRTTYVVGKTSTVHHSSAHLLRFKILLSLEMNLARIHHETCILGEEILKVYYVSMNFIVLKIKSLESKVQN